MAKARAIVKRRKAVRNTRKITKTMQMIATAKFQKSLKRAVGTKPFTHKTHEVVEDLVRNVGEFSHSLLESPDRAAAGKVTVLVIAGNRGLAGAYNGNVVRTGERLLRQLEEDGKTVELHTAGKKAYAYFAFQKRPVVQRYDQIVETSSFEAIRELADQMMKMYADGETDAVYVTYMNFISTGVQKPEVLKLLPLEGMQKAKGQGTQPGTEGATGGVTAEAGEAGETVPYEFAPSARELLDELLPITVRTTLFQCFLDAATSENVARMVSMKAATDNAEKMIKQLTMQYNRARQSQITTELSEIMGGVEAMKK